MTHSPTPLPGPDHILNDSPTLCRRALLAGFAAAPIIAMAPGSVAAGPRSRLIDQHWTQSGAVASVDHSAWGAFIDRYLRMGADGVALLDYGGVTPSDRAGLDQYVDSLTRATPTSLTPNAAYAYWLNLYNALTVQLVLEAYPVSTIKRVRGGLFGVGPWREKVITVEGRELSLDDIEHGILRPIYKDPRIHYGVNCASIGCPNLDAKPFTAETLEAQLDAAARAYVNHPRGARFDNRGRLIVSSIYDWFVEDFGDNDAGVIAHLKAYAAPELKARLDRVSSIYDDEYDWSLNDAGVS